MVTLPSGFAPLRSDEEGKFLYSLQTLNYFLAVGFCGLSVYITYDILFSASGATLLWCFSS